MNQNKFKEFINTILLVYFIIILGLTIFTIRKHKVMDMDEKEHFYIMSPRMKYSSCKDSCLLKYNGDKDKLKVCKSYCKCNNKCNMSFSSKKCKKKCKEKKLNLYRDDESKMEKIEIKDKLKKERRENKKKEKIKEMEKERELKKKEEESQSETKGYLNRIVNEYLSEEDKENIVNMSKGTKKFTKDIKKTFSKYF